MLGIFQQILTNLNPRNTPSGYSRRVARLRIVLPLLAILVIAGLMLWPYIAGQQKISLPESINLPQLTMVAPEISGMDDQRRPYRIKAEKAVQNPDNIKIVDLHQINGQFQVGADQTVSGSAPVGRFDQGSKKLWLGGAVNIIDQRGYQFTTSEMFVDTEQKTIWGDKPATVTGNFGTISGEGYRIYNEGKTVLFTGKSRAIINMNELKDSPSAALTAPSASDSSAHEETQE